MMNVIEFLSRMSRFSSILIISHALSPHANFMVQCNRRSPPHNYPLYTCIICWDGGNISQWVYLYKCMHEKVASILELATKIHVHIVLCTFSTLTLHSQIVISTFTVPVLNDTTISHKVIFHSDGTPNLCLKFLVGWVHTSYTLVTVLYCWFRVHYGEMTSQHCPLAIVLWPTFLWEYFRSRCFLLVIQR